jgi:hypothetical protein
LPTELFDLTEANRRFTQAQGSMLRSLKWAGGIGVTIAAVCFAVLGFVGFPIAAWACVFTQCENPWGDLALLWFPALIVGAICLAGWRLWGRPPAASLRIEDSGVIFVLPSGHEVASRWADGRTLACDVEDWSGFLARNPKLQSTIPYRYQVEGRGFGPTPLPDPVYRALETAAKSHGFVPELGMDNRGVRAITFRRSN